MSVSERQVRGFLTAAFWKLDELERVLEKEDERILKGNMGGGWDDTEIDDSKVKALVATLEQVAQALREHLVDQPCKRGRRRATDHLELEKIIEKNPLLKPYELKAMTGDSIEVARRVKNRVCRRNSPDRARTK